MEWNEMQKARIALFAELVSRIPATSMGRTMLMKLCYFLQELKGVPLGYRFTIYSYGPFDSEVLSDLGTAVDLGAVSSRVVYNSVGYGYQLEAGSRAERLKAEGAQFLAANRESIDWAIAEFAAKSSSDLELESTAVFVDKEAASKGEVLSAEILTDRVRNLKPHFVRNYVLERVQDLAARNLVRPFQGVAGRALV